MGASYSARLSHAASNVFSRNDQNTVHTYENASSYRPDRPRIVRGGERSIVNSIYSRIAIDAASYNIRHVRLDENKRFLEEIDSGLNNCLSIEANIDQTGRALIQDVVLTMCDEGCAAVIPVETTLNPKLTTSYDILNMRCGKIQTWYPDSVDVLVYNEKTGKKELVHVPKRSTAIIENPLYSIMNSPNSTMTRLIRKLSLMDTVDDRLSSGKLDMIIKLPYLVKSEARRKQANDRRKEVEEQLVGSKYGIAYIDGTEDIIQLGHSLENNLQGEVQYLTSMLYSQLGITDAVMDGTADERVMLNYINRTIEPIVSAISGEFTRKFLSKTARTQRQTIATFSDPFRLVPVANIAEIADKFTRNEIMTSNEIRQVIGIKPSEDPKADMLVNSNISQPMEMMPGYEEGLPEGEEVYDETYEE